MGMGVRKPWVGVQYTMNIEVKIPWIGVDIPWIGGLIYHGYGGQHTMDTGSGSIYHE